MFLSLSRVVITEKEPVYTILMCTHLQQLSISNKIIKDAACLQVSNSAFPSFFVRILFNVFFSYDLIR